MASAVSVALGGQVFGIDMRLGVVRTGTVSGTVTALREGNGRHLDVTPLDRAVLAERTMALERHFRRVGSRPLPASRSNPRRSGT
jgi:hypothetical protein